MAGQGHTQHTQSDILSSNRPLSATLSLQTVRCRALLTPDHLPAAGIHLLTTMRAN
jgi:hypothetical protein